MQPWLLVQASLFFLGYFLTMIAPSSSSSSSPVHHKTFARALSNSFDIPLSQLPRPCIKGDSISIKISEDEYMKGLEGCKNNLHGRIILTKGTAPIKFVDLQEKLGKLWKPIGHWRMVPLGKGYYEFSFSSPEDHRSVWVVGSWNLNPGILRLSQSSKDFNPKSKANSCSNLGQNF